MTMQKMQRALFASMLTISVISLTGAAKAQEFHKGKRVTMVVGLAPGGGLDIMARLFSKHLARHIPGSPDIVVQNMPGAAGATAMNFMATKAPKDGYTVIYDSWTPLEQIIKSSHVNYDYTKMTYIGALRGGPWMLFARKSVVPGGLNDPKDIIKATDLENLAYDAKAAQKLEAWEQRLEDSVLPSVGSSVRVRPSEPASDPFDAVSPGLSIAPVGVASTPIATSCTPLE